MTKFSLMLCAAWILFGALSLSAQVPAPMNLTATVTGASVALAWTSPDSGRRISFLVSRRVGTGAFSQVASTGAQTYTDANLQPATYSYRVREKNGNRYSDYSNVVSVTVGPIPPPTGGISSALTLGSNAITIGQTLTGIAVLTNNGQSTVTINQVVITSRPPGGTNSGGPYDNFIPQLGVTSIVAGASVSLNASRVFGNGDPTGAWYAFVTYQDTTGTWHDGNSVPFSVSGSTPPPPGGLSVRVQGNKLINAAGSPIRLIGFNRSGTEYACIQGWGIFDGPNDAASIAAMKAWNINAVRVPLNEDCWLAINGANPTFSGANYATAIVSYVNLLHQAGIYAILDLHWSAPGSSSASSQTYMADADHSPAFWVSVANAFKNDPAVLYDLYNEPHDITDACWRDGCVTPGGWQAVGMQALINDIRSTGATQPFVVTANGWGNHLAGYMNYRPTDPLNSIVAAVHIYNFSGCDLSCWQQYITPMAAVMPVVSGEFGETNCAADYVLPFMNWMDMTGAGYVAWAWTVAACSNPSLITDYSGSATGFGAGIKSHYQALPPN